MTYPPANPRPVPPSRAALLESLAALDIGPAVLSRAAEIAAVTQDLTADETLAHAALLHASLGGAAARGVEHAAVREHAGAGVQRLAAALARLGEFRLDEHWAREQSLAPQQAETLRKMLLAVVGDPRLVVARLAEQLVRARHARELPDAERRRVALETRDLYAPLANRLGIWELKWELEDLAFRELDPDNYRLIAAALNAKRTDREHYIDKVRALLSARLTEASITAEVTGRPKHIYSIWRKMERKHVPFEALFDVRAARIIVATVADCYAALGVVHSLWQFLPGEFDDYIATPKDNDYRSIHTAVAGPDGLSLEVQIRTREMQQQAERGVAAHWMYKEGARSGQDYESKIEAVRALLEHGNAHADESDSLMRASAGLFADRIYALTPKGEVVDLPTGATPLDFAFHVHSDLGQRCRGAKINGRIVPLDTKVTNGDVIEVITGRNAAPSRDWLSAESRFLASARSRSKLRSYFRRLDEAAKPVEAAPPVAEESPSAPAPDTLPLRVTRRRTSTSSSKSPVDIEGVGDLPVILARCCAPVRPQPIGGYLTLARGVTIHRTDCASFQRMLRAQPERQLKVEWAGGELQALPTTIAIGAYDRRGLLRDITDLIAEQRLSIEGVTSHTDPADRIARIDVRLAVKDATELARLLQRLRAIPNVFEARRATG
jgi:GTP pyrophosphokinase